MPSRVSRVGSESPRLEFRVKLAGVDGMETATLVPPFDVVQVFGKKGRVAVRGSINGSPFRSSLMNMGEGHMMVVNAALRKAAGCKAGDVVEVVMEEDREERVVDVPEYLIKLIQSDAKTAESWEKLSFTHRKEYVREITEARKPETKERRIAATMGALRKGERKR